MASIHAGKGNDACNTGSNIRYAGKDDEGVLHVAHSSNQPVSEENEHNRNQAEAAADSLDDDERVDLVESQLLIIDRDGIYG